MTIDDEVEELNTQGGELNRQFHELREQHAWMDVRRSDPEQAIIAVAALVQEAYFSRKPESIKEAQDAVGTVTNIFERFAKGEYGPPLIDTKNFVGDYIRNHRDSRLAIEQREADRVA